MLSLYVTMQAVWPAVTAVPLYVTMQAVWPAVTVRVLCNTIGSTTIAELQILMTSCLCNLYNKEALCNCNFLCPTTCDYHFFVPQFVLLLFTVYPVGKGRMSHPVISVTVPLKYVMFLLLFL